MQSQRESLLIDCRAYLPLFWVSKESLTKKAASATDRTKLQFYDGHRHTYLFAIIATAIIKALC